MLLRRIARAAGTAVLAAALTFGAAAQQSDQLVNNLERALQMQADKDWNGLLAHLQKWEEEGGRDPIILELRAEALRNSNNNAAALEALQQLLNDTPDTDPAQRAELLRQIGATHADEGNLEEAEKAMRLALTINENAPTWLQLAQILTENEGDPDQTEVAWNRALAYGQYINDPDLWRTYAEFLDTLGDDEKTYKAYSHVARLAPGDLPAWRRLFVIADELDNEPARRVTISRLSRIDANGPLVNAFLGWEAQQRGEIRMAKLHYDIAVQAADEDAPAKWRALTHLGLARITESREEAFDNYREALLIDPALFAAWEGAIVTLRNLRRLTEARIYAEKFFQVKVAVSNGRPLPVDLLVDL